jgi:hypothetical protein
MTFPRKQLLIAYGIKQINNIWSVYIKINPFVQIFNMYYYLSKKEKEEESKMIIVAQLIISYNSCDSKSINLSMQILIIVLFYKYMKHYSKHNFAVRVLNIY